ncbi:Response regulator receiver domain-containing protein [Cohaesibacter marisflavi]|uniref:Response regulator receiver domain-containing protein n=2 Tax=Cohaesibacter marisflavi TaxID=655353 RepID=A0A1I5CLK6_9HYPH|nr:Response regulator receiver domain-containing protein [Cohaesibacter marisflavi]
MTVQNSVNINLYLSNEFLKLFYLTYISNKYTFKPIFGKVMIRTHVDAASEQAGSSEVAASLKILVAEDSSITQDLLKLVLQQRGHAIEIADNGKDALSSLLADPFDLVLLDFHMPGMTGIEVLAHYDEATPDHPRPHFVAVTADIEGLMAHEKKCERFDAIVPKPLNIQEILSIIDDVLAERQSQPPKHQETAPFPKAASPSAPPQSGVPFTEGFRCLRWPDDFAQDEDRQRTLKLLADNTPFDAIIISQTIESRALLFLWQMRGLHLLPLIDTTGTLGAMADINAASLSAQADGSLTRIIDGFHTRRALVHRAILNSDILSDKLLTRLFIADRSLQPHYASQSRSGVAFNIPLDSETIFHEASKLQQSGFLHVRFFDRFHVCNNCGSAHFNIREECPSCHSSNLTESAYIHHFKCAHQAPEADFIQGDELICPKCRQRLLHFGSDYDKPGIVVSCQSCGHTTSEPDVGFVCLDCHSRFSGDAVETRDVYHYDLQEKARDYLRIGPSYMGLTQNILSFSDLPLDIIVSLNEQAKRFNEFGESFAFLEIRYQKAQELERDAGPRQFIQTRELFIETLRGIFSSVLGPEGHRIVKGHSSDFAILKKTAPEEIQSALGGIIEQARQPLRLDPGIQITVFGPGDLFT